ncbi:MAG TPA: multiheme c-type cytochrome, partial [Gemmataceae bacterium]|nr:multiheme c-type cytochrome [Gemmataceae bacterium]
LWLLLLGGGIAWLARPRGQPRVPAAALRAATVVELATPYRNARPGVAYVGDRACAACHADIASAYHQHPMGRSLAMTASVVGRQDAPRKPTSAFEAPGLRCEVQVSGPRLVQRVRFPTAPQEPAHEQEVQYVLGSGTRGQSYLIEHDGLLFQAPISWYTQRAVWDLAPGYARKIFFDRKVRVECLFCHANQVEPVPGTECRYREPVFRGLAIGCERCHGPGQLHVARQESGDRIDGNDDTIVNPARLEPALREAVCQQCHLAGALRFLARGRQAFDYRPGLPLYPFWANFTRPATETDNKVVNQVEQMYSSRCFQASKGQLGCISCHDPHVKPPENKKIAYYRDRCLQCHTARTCTLSLAERRRLSPADSCTQCHMPRFPTADVAHTAATDHRILRSPSAHPNPGGKARALPDLPVVNFYQDLLDPRDPEARRDQGVALALWGFKGHGAAYAVARRALGLLNEALRRAPDDFLAHKARAWVEWQLGERPHALQSIRAALQESPLDEEALETAATFCQAMGRSTDAIAYSRRLIGINPWQGSYHARLAQLLTDSRQWDEVEAECRAALRTDITNVDVRFLLVRALLHKNKVRESQEVIGTIEALRPADRTRIEQWLLDQQRRLGLEHNGAKP